MLKILSNYDLVFNKFVDAIKPSDGCGYCELWYPDIYLKFDKKDLEFYNNIKVIQCTKDTFDIIYRDEKMSFDIKTIKLVAEMI